jgi:hypothetical protein
VAVASPAKPRPRRGWRRPVRRSSLTLLAIVATYAAATWVLGAIPIHADYRPAGRGVTVVVASNGVHTDFYLPARHPAKDWATFAPLEDASTDAARAPYVLVGWGDRGFSRLRAYGSRSGRRSTAPSSPS